MSRLWCLRLSLEVRFGLDQAHQVFDGHIPIQLTPLFVTDLPLVLGVHQSLEALFRFRGETEGNDRLKGWLPRQEAGDF